MTPEQLGAAETELRRRLVYNLTSHMQRLRLNQASLGRRVSPYTRHDVHNMKRGIWSSPGLVAAVTLAMGLDVGALYQPTPVLHQPEAAS